MIGTLVLVYCAITYFKIIIEH